MPETVSLPTRQTTLSSYIGRFAPSPTGPLHTGSLVAALASWLDARANNGQWLMRMEDLDPPRESKQAASDILFALDKLGLHWDGPVVYQSQRHDAYDEAIQHLEENSYVFACDCTRQQIQDAGGVYPGTCRSRHLVFSKNRALRCQVPDEVISFTDLIQGHQSQSLQREVGDFVIKRKDGLFAYQLAVVVDDAWQNITHIIRGIDLLNSTPRQIYLQRLLGLPHPFYGHIPVIINEHGQKLSKQHMAAPINPEQPARLLFESLTYLQQTPDPALEACSTEEILNWGISHWNPDNLNRIEHLREFEQSL